MSSEVLFAQSPDCFPLHDGELLEAVRCQLDYYFSPANFPTDTYLQSQLSIHPKKGVPVDVICNFRRIQALTRSRQVVLTAMKFCKNLHLDEDSTGQGQDLVRPVEWSKDNTVTSELTVTAQKQTQSFSEKAIGNKVEHTLAHTRFTTGTGRNRVKSTFDDGTSFHPDSLMTESQSQQAFIAPAPTISGNPIFIATNLIPAGVTGIPTVSVHSTPLFVLLPSAPLLYPHSAGGTDMNPILAYGSLPVALSHYQWSSLFQPLQLMTKKQRKLANIATQQQQLAIALAKKQQKKQQQHQ